MFLISKIVKCCLDFFGMSVKEIKELEDEIREIDVSEAEEDVSDWEEDDVEDDVEDLEEEESEFSIGDTMLARGESVESWGNESLEESVDWEEVEDFGGAGFSYESVGNSDGDLYGVSSSSAAGDLYGTDSSSGGNDLYGAGKVDGPSNLYDAGTGGEANLYNAGGGSGNSGSSISYDVNGGKKKGKRKVGGSGLEGISKKKKGVRRRGASIL